MSEEREYTFFDIEALSEVPVGRIPGALIELASAQATLAARLAGRDSSSESQPKGEGAEADRDRFLSVKETAKMLDRPASWVYENRALLKECFVQTKHRGKLQFSEKALQRWMSDNLGKEPR